MDRSSGTARKIANPAGETLQRGVGTHPPGFQRRLLQGVSGSGAPAERQALSLAHPTSAVELPVMHLTARHRTDRSCAVACPLVSCQHSEDGVSVVAGKDWMTQTWPALTYYGAGIVVGLADRSPSGQGVVQLAREYSALVVVDHIGPGDQ